MESEVGSERIFQRRKWVNYQTLREELYSVFIDNIPVGKDVDWLRALFSKDGRALDVFIPARGRRVSNSRFGFVRYQSLREAEAAIRRWNGANVGKAKLLVLLADNGGKPKAGFRYTRRGLQGGRGGFGMGGVGSVWSPTAVREDQESLGGVKVKDAYERQKRTKRRVVLEAFEEQEDWLHFTLVAELKISKLGESVENEMRKEEIAFVKIIPAGGRNVLIQFGCSEDLEKCLVNDYRSVLRNFNHLKRWREEDVPKSRSVWISLLGLPFRAWTDRNCERLAGPYGVLLKMDDRDVRFVGVGRARMLIETTLVERICETVEAEIAGKVYEIGLCEDCCLGGCEMDSPQSVEEEGNSDGSTHHGGVGPSSGSDKGEQPAGQHLRKAISVGSVGGAKNSISPNNSLIVPESDQGVVASSWEERQVEAVSGADGSHVEGGQGVLPAPPPRAVLGVGGVDGSGPVAVGLADGQEEDISNFDSIGSVGGVDSINSANTSLFVPESVQGTLATSWVSILQSVSKETSLPGGVGGIDSNKENQKKLNDFGGLGSFVLDRGECQREKMQSKDDSEKERSSCLSDKYLSVLKMVRRREAKVRKDIRYQRRKQLRSCEINQDPEKGVRPSYQPREEELVVEQSQKESCGAVEGQQEERSSDHFDKTLSAFKLLRRRESKEKKAIKDQRSLRKDKLEGLKRSYVEELVRSKASISSKSKEKVSDEERRKLIQRKAAEESLRVVSRVGMKFLGTEEEGIQFFINHDESMRKERGRPCSVV